MSDSKTVITTCTRDCPNACGLVATVKDGRLTGLAGNPDHPLTRGVACVKAARYVKRVYSPERITHPMLRRNGRWVRAGWDEVLDLVAERLKTFAAESGTESILYYQGYGERTALKLLNKYFFNLFGGVTTLRGSLCGGAGQASQNLDLGQRISHDPLDHFNSQAMILWARNPVSTNISLTAIARDIRSRGGSVLLIDPARSKSAVLADHHIAPRPGGDVFLAMAAAKLVLAAGAEDREFLARHAVGVEAYLEILSGFPVDDLCRRAGVSRGEAELLAETLMGRRPASILLGWGLHRHEYAHYGIRAIDALAAICGNLGVPGGGVSQGFEEYGPYDQRLWGDDLNPPRRTLLLPVIGREILAAKDPAIRMIYVTAANPLCMAPNTAAVAEAFRKAEFVVYSGHTMDDTSDYAHVFLPATTFLEEIDVMASYGHNYVGPVNPAIPPVGQCKSEFRMFYELAARFPFADRFCKSEEEWLRTLCAPVWEQGGDPESLRQEAFRLDAPMVPYADKVFPTPSGKFQFMTAFDPSHIPEPDPAYPYRFLTIAPHGYICSERTMADHEPLPVVRLAASEAAKRGLAHGMPVVVKSPLGEALATLRVEEGLRPDILVADRGGWNKAGHGLNRLTRDLASRVGNGTPYYETAVTVCPVPNEGPAGRRILVVQHSERAPGGDFVKGLARLGALPTTVNPARGDDLPESPEGFDALVVLGGPQHASDDAASPHFPALLALMRAFDAENRPVAGICLGAQLLARAHGGRPQPMGRLEFGFTTLAATAEGQVDPVLGPALPLPRLMEFHEDTFDLPPGAVALVTGQACPNQCFRVGAASYGFQFHLEVDSVIASNWITLFRQGGIDTYAPYREAYGESYFAGLAADLPVLVAESQEFCRRVVRNWLALA
ncbi:MAG: molybdopterin-dependent oxidoreductase [Desulfovibrionaceae bacterium]|nr:molybdopterin-dependent oxidoreductase [Desulfovibrionaceae bacterium]